MGVLLGFNGLVNSWRIIKQTSERHAASMWIGQGQTPEGYVGVGYRGLPRDESKGIMKAACKSHRVGGPY